MFELPAAALTAEKSSPRKADVGALKMNGREIKEKRFDKAAMFGYKAEEVDLYLAEVAQAFDSLVKEKAVLEKKITILAERIEEYRKDENSMKEALLGAQRLGNTVVAEAQAKADKLLSEAQAKSEEMLREAEKTATRSVSGVKAQVEKEQQTLRKMQKEVSGFKARLLNLYKSHLDLITALPEAEEEKPQEAAAPAEEKAAPIAEESAAEASKPAQEEKAAAVVEPVSSTAPTGPVDPVERAKQELENTQQIAKKQLGVVSGDLEQTQQISFAGSSQHIPFKSERVDMEKSFEQKFGELKFGKNNK